MQLFKDKNNVLIPIETDSFKLEKSIQTLVEANLELLFDLELVSSEFSVANSRIDSLAFDKQNKSFVIVEYKKEQNYSVVDQGFSYLAVMLNNKSDFILEYNEKTEKKLRRNDVDWTSSRVILVSPSFTTQQKNSVNFKDVPFELWEIRKFEDELIAIEQYTSSSNESIKELSKGNSRSVIAKVSSEVKVLSEEDHVNILDESIKHIWASLRQKLENHSDTSFAVKKQYISWKLGNNAVCFIFFSKKELRFHIQRGNMNKKGKLSKGFFTIDDPKDLTTKNSWQWESGSTGHQYRLSLKKPEQMNYVIFLLEQKYTSLV